VILVTIGTNEQPFDRLVRAAAALDARDDVVVQYGSSRAVTPRPGWFEFMPFDELAALAGDSRVVVCHAGVGSIMMARRCGHRPIVVPRRHGLAEAVDDHQVGLARRLAQGGLVTLVEDAATLGTAVRQARTIERPGGVTGLPGADALAADLRARLTRRGVASAIRVARARVSSGRHAGGWWERP
jgi:UDP-N-acetylglucosamine transferase subunit ALG13